MSLPLIAASPVEPPMIALLRHVGRMTEERRRPRLEALMLEALLDLTHGRCAVYHKVLQSGERLLSWPAVSAGKDGTTISDDGITAPEVLTPLDADGLAAAALLEGRPRQVALGRGQRLLFPVLGPGSALGLIEIDFDRPPASADAMLIDGVLAIFRHVMGLLDYSEVDSLTGLLNRKTFDEHLMRILANLANGDDAADPQGRRRGAPGDGSHWLGVLDIDHFKRINDNFGHLIGDEVLLMVANLMRNTFRFRDKLFRFGGEEFVVVLKPAGADAARMAFERFRATLEAHAFPQVGRVTISIGYAPIHLHDQPSLILERADQALYWAKANGRNRAAAYDDLVAAGQLAPLVERESAVELF